MLSESKEHKSYDQLALELVQIHRAYAVLTNSACISDATAPPFAFVNADDPTFTVAIVASSNLDLFIKTLASVVLCTERVQYQIVIIDTNKASRVAEISALVKGARLIHVPGFNRLTDICAICAEDADGDYLVTIKSGVEVQQRWLDEFLLTFDDFKRCGLITPRVRISSGLLERTSFDLSCDGGDTFCYYELPALEDSYVHEASFISDACLAVRISAVSRLGGPDRTYKTHKFAMRDLCMRLDLLNYTAIYTPFIEVAADVSVFNNKNLVTEPIDDTTYDSIRFKARWHHFAQMQTLKSSFDYSLIGRKALKRALILDAETPKPDKNAGGYAAVQEIQLLQSLGFNCTFVPMDLLRVERYTQDLQRKGVRCIHGPSVASINEFIQLCGSEFDLVYVTRYQVAQNSIEVIREFAPRAKIILMIADLHFLRQIRSALYNCNDVELGVAIQTREEELEVMRKVAVHGPLSRRIAKERISHF
jgi:hypothetical protein